MSNRKKINKYEAFEKSFKTQIPGKSKKVVMSDKKESSLILGVILLPFVVLAKTIKFCVLGPTERQYTKSPYAKVYGVFSGMFMLFSSVLGLFFINDIGDFLKTINAINGWVVPINAFLVIFFLIQLVRGSGFMSGYNIGQTGAVNATKWYNPNIKSSNYSYPTSSRGNSRSEIDDFKGYVNSKMSWMSNSDKEIYVKELFGGKK
jgi:hypothetical protein